MPPSPEPESQEVASVRQSRNSNISPIAIDSARVEAPNLLNYPVGVLIAVKSTGAFPQSANNEITHGWSFRESDNLLEP